MLWLGYGLEFDSWKPEKNLSLEVFKKYWNTIAYSKEWLIQNKGVIGVNVSNKITRRKNKQN